MKKNNRIIAVPVALLLLTALCACNVKVDVAPADGNDSVFDEKSEEITGIEEEEIAGMANPMVEVINDSDFSDKLGINIDTSYISGEELKRFVIGDTLADIRFKVTNVDGDLIECMLRATKDEKAAQNPYELIAGIYANDLSEEVSVTYPSDEGDIELISVDSKSDNCQITRWDFGSTHYVFVVFGTTSQMQLSALYDSLMLATGIDHASRLSLEPLVSSIDVTDISGGEFAVNIDNIETDENGTIADFAVYTMDLYDAVEVNSLAPGDVIKVRELSDVDLKTIVVETVEHKTVSYSAHEEALGAGSAGDKDVVIINGGLDKIGEGGVELIADEGGTYRYFGFDDYGTYVKQGTVNLQIAEDAEIVDHSEDWNSEEEVPAGVTLKTTELMQFALEDGIGFSFRNTTALVENGVVTKITRRYTP